MTDLFAARSQMAMSLAFHILFAVAGMAMPLLMVMAEAAWLRTRDPGWRELAVRWSKGTAILFAVGAVSGTVLSFELGLLWPGFMAFAGPIVGMPFSLEGFAFFLEAIFLGVYLYGWERVSPWAHLGSGVMVALCGTLSGAFVVTANAWMNSPTGFTLVDGVVVDIDPWAAMFNPMAASQVLHMTLAAFSAVGLAVAGIHAWVLLRDPTRVFHRRALALALLMGGVASLLQPLSGHMSGEAVAELQPVKLAAMEGQFETERAAPLRLGGWPDVARRETTMALEIPYALSLLAHRDPHAEVLGLDAFPEEDWPPVPVVHLAFQVMIACGTAMAAVSALALGLMAWRRRVPLDRWLLRLVVAASPLGLIAIEAGWTVTEVGRQPWVVQGVMRTADAVTPMPGLIVPFVTFSLLYLVLGLVVLTLVRLQVMHTAPGGDDGAA
jgi:cytochrome d ubiquinol oxidase subunit I